MIELQAWITDDSNGHAMKQRPPERGPDDSKVQSEDPAGTDISSSEMKADSLGRAVFLGVMPDDFWPRLVGGQVLVLHHPMRNRIGIIGRGEAAR